MFTLPTSLLSRSESHRDSFVLKPSDLGLSEHFEDSPIGLDVELTRSGEGILARGKVTAKARLECSRCLEPFEMELEQGFTVDFEPLGKDQTVPEGLEDSPGYVAFHGEDLPLGEELRQELELTLPFKPVCRQDCLGLCPRCGANLNQTRCECPSQEGAGPFAALNDLFRESRKGKHEDHKGEHHG